MNTKFSNLCPGVREVVEAPIELKPLHKTIGSLYSRSKMWRMTRAESEVPFRIFCRNEHILYVPYLNLYFDWSFIYADKTQIDIKPVVWKTNLIHPPCFWKLQAEWFHATISFTVLKTEFSVVETNERRIRENAISNVVEVGSPSYLIFSP